MRTLALLPILLAACTDPNHGPVTLTIEPGSRGIVVSTPEGIRCGRCDGPPPYGPLMCPDTTDYMQCAASFPFGEVVHVAFTLSEAVSYTCGFGYPFGNEGCDVVMDSDKTLRVIGGTAAHEDRPR